MTFILLVTDPKSASSSSLLTALILLLRLILLGLGLFISKFLFPNLLRGLTNLTLCSLYTNRSYRFALFPSFSDLLFSLLPAGC